MSEIQTILADQRIFFNTDATKDIHFRILKLKQLYQSIKKHESEILNALHHDLSKAPFESYETEIGIVLEEIKHTISHLPHWAKKKRVHTPLIHFPSRSYVYNDPYGVVLIMSPWNYPFQLTMVPLIGAIATGNCAIVKPSAYSQQTSTIIETIIQEVFDTNHVAVIQGGREANQNLLKERFDYIFFTGSPAVGHYVMECASKYLTPITLELGGKSPCIVDKNAKIKLAARRIVWGKSLNGGQTCIAPDYLLVHKEVKEELINEMRNYIIEFYGEKPENNPHYPKVITEKHFNRLLGLFKDEKIVFGGRFNQETQKISPTLVDNVSWESPIMQEEIFGPLLPIMTFDNFNKVIDLLKTKEKPLALYLFTNDKKHEQDLLKKVSFGGGCINDTIIHISNSHFAFGGVGGSGMGQYHGKASFDTFSHKKSIIKKSNLVDIFLRYPPFKNHLGLLKKLMN